MRFAAVDNDRGEGFVIEADGTSADWLVPVPPYQNEGVTWERREPPPSVALRLLGGVLTALRWPA